MLCGFGIAVAGLYTLVHVCAGGHLLCTGGKFETLASPEATAAAGYGSGAAHYGAGIGLRLAGKPQLSGMGLPTDAPEFFGADLPSLQLAVGSGESGSDGALRLDRPGNSAVSVAAGWGLTILPIWVYNVGIIL